MLSRWIILASAASWLVGLPLAAQPPKTPVIPIPNTAGTSVIIPVSYTNEQVAAVVNGERVLVGEVRKLIDRQPYPFALTEEQKKTIRKVALDSLIDDILMRQYLQKQIPQVSQADFNKEFAELEEALKKANKTYAAFLKEAGETEAELRRDIIARIQWRTILLRLLPEEKARAYYNENKVFFDKVMVRASHILIVPANASKEERDRAVQAMLVWRQEILTGKAKFEDVAKQYSQDPETKGRGGDWGVHARYKFDLDPEIAKVVYSMRVGEISGPVVSAKGVHLLKLTERTKGEISNFETIKEAVREVWAQDEELIPRILADQRKRGEIKVSLP